MLKTIKKTKGELKEKVGTALAVAIILHGAATGKLFGNESN